MKLNKSKVLTMAIAAAVATFGILSYYTETFDWIEKKSYDSRTKWTSKKLTPSEDISVVLLDQESLNWAKEELGWSYPWPRESYAKIIDFFNRANAASVAFDIVYTEPSVYGKEDDEEFARANRDFGKSIQAVFYDMNNSDKATLPIDVIKDSSAKIATVQSLLDNDGVVRRARFHSSSSLKEPSLTVASLELSDEMPDMDSIPKAKHAKENESEEGMYVRFMPSLDDYIPYSAKLILQSEMAIEKAENEGIPYEAEGDLLPLEQFDGSHVFIGLFAPGLFDICSTPIDSNYPGVGVHIAMMDTILQENYLSDVAETVSIFLIVAFSIFGTIFATAFNQKSKFFYLKTLLCAFVFISYLAISYIEFLKGTILPVTIPLFSMILAFVSAVIKSYLTEGKQKRFIKNAFKQYLSSDVIDQIMENPDSLKLGGTEKEITAFFSDVQGFTSISESLTPAELTHILNKYLTAMTNIIMSHGGLIDKYEGDAIIAFWNGPIDQPDHAKRAVEAAIDCQLKLSEMRAELEELAGKPIKHRIGLNTGRAVVGNFGSEQKFDYTMLGDTVNLASRLEGINKQFGTYTMCSKATMDSAIKFGCDKSFRKLSNIAVVGKKEGVVVFEPMENEDFNTRKDDFMNFEIGYNQFVKGEFEKAIETFRKTSDKDPAAAKYIEKCLALIKNPPANWDGILRATEK